MLKKRMPYGCLIPRLGAFASLALLVFAASPPAAAQHGERAPATADDYDTYVVARGEDHEGWPVLELSVNGLPVATITVGSREHARYDIDLPINATPVRRVELAYVNDHVAESGPGDRNVFVTRLVVDGRELLLGDAEHLDENPYNSRGLLYANARLRWVLAAETANGEEETETECGASGNDAVCLPTEALDDRPLPGADDCIPAAEASEADWEAANRYAASLIDAEQRVERADLYVEDARSSFGGNVDETGHWQSDAIEPDLLAAMQQGVTRAGAQDVTELRALRERLEESMAPNHGDEVAGYLSPTGPHPDERAVLNVLNDMIDALERLQDAYDHRTEVRGMGGVMCRD